MIILANTTDQLQIVLGGSITTNQLRCVSSWRDIAAAAFTPGRTVANTNNTTDVDAVPAPAASTQRVIDFINVYNSDTVAATVTLKYDANGTEYTVWSGSLAAGESVQFVEGSGWTKVGASGAPILGSITAINGTANEITATTVGTVVTLSLPTSITLTGKTLTNGTFVNPALGTPASGNLVNCTGYVGTSALVITGALNSGSITSGFGAIDIGTDALTAGAISGTTLQLTSTLTGNATVAGNYFSRLTNNDTGASSWTELDIANSARALKIVTLSTGWSGAFLTGGPATESSAIYTSGNIPISIGINTTEVARFTSTGLNSTVIGATTPAAGSFTTLGATGKITGVGSTTGGLTLGDASGNTGASIRLLGSSTTRNFEIASQTQTSNTLTFTESTANGGSTFTTPILILTGGGGIQVGAPTGADKGVGTANFAADIYKNNTAFTNPDYVLEKWATGSIVKYADKEGAKDYDGLKPLAEVEAFAKEKLHLPRFGQNANHGIFSGSDALLASVEEAYLYLFQQDAELKALRARVAKLEAI